MVERCNRRGEPGEISLKTAIATHEHAQARRDVYRWDAEDKLGQEAVRGAMDESELPGATRPVVTMPADKAMELQPGACAARAPGHTNDEQLSTPQGRLHAEHGGRQGLTTPHKAQHDNDCSIQTQHMALHNKYNGTHTHKPT